jgi:hypothetical protein
MLNRHPEETLFMLLAALALQVTPTPPLPPANPLPPPAADEAAVLAPIERMFAGLAARDGARIKAETRADARAIVSVTRADGTRSVRSLSLAEFADGMKPGPEQFEERLVSPAIEIDGDIAMVWSPYVFLIDGKLSHCGIDHFGMVREGGGWKVASLAWTQRKTECPTP